MTSQFSLGEQPRESTPFTRMSMRDISQLSARDAIHLIVEHEELLAELPVSALREIIVELRSGFSQIDLNHVQQH